MINSSPGLEFEFLTIKIGFKIRIKIISKLKNCQLSLSFVIKIMIKVFGKVAISPN